MADDNAADALAILLFAAERSGSAATPTAIMTPAHRIPEAPTHGRP